MTGNIYTYTFKYVERLIGFNRLHTFKEIKNNDMVMYKMSNIIGTKRGDI